MPASSAASTTSRASCCVAVERVPRPEPDDRAEAPFLHQPSMPRATQPAANAAAKNAGSSSGPRPMCESGRPAQASLPAARRPNSSRPSHDARVRRPGTDVEAADAGACDARRRGAARAGRPRTCARRATGRPPSASAAFAASAAARRAVPESRPRADDPGPDRADGDVEPFCPRPGERGRRRSRTGRHRRRTARPRPRPRAARAACRARTVSDSETGSAPPPICTYATRTPRRAPRRPVRAGCAACSRRPAARRAMSASGADSSRMRAAIWPGVYGSDITCAPRSGASPRPRVRFA